MTTQEGNCLRSVFSIYTCQMLTQQGKSMYHNADVTNVEKDQCINAIMQKDR